MSLSYYTLPDIPKLIAEAKEKGIPLYRYIAMETWGEYTVETHRMAKNLAFGHLYGGTVKIMSEQEREPFLQELMNVWPGIARLQGKMLSHREVANKLFPNTQNLRMMPPKFNIAGTETGRTKGSNDETIRDDN
jgi:hypothetical protein